MFDIKRMDAYPEYVFYNEEILCGNNNSSRKIQFYPIDILDYIYAVLHSPAYREKYKEFLKFHF